MASIFEYLDYRKLIRDLSQAKKKKRAGWTLQRLATETGVQPPYLTNVLKGRAHLNGDQLYLAAKALGFQDDEVAFSLLLLEWERSASEERRKELLAQIERMRKTKLKSEAHLKAKAFEVPAENVMRYYLNPDLQLVYAFLAVKKFSRGFDALARALNIDVERVEALVKELQEMGFVRVEEKGIEKLHRSLHLPKDSPLLHAQQQVMRLRAFQHLQSLAEKDKYGFMVTFTADEATRERIQREFLKFLAQVETWVKDAPSESAYQMSFDLFPWVKT